MCTTQQKTACCSKFVKACIWDCMAKLNKYYDERDLFAFWIWTASLNPRNRPISCDPNRVNLSLCRSWWNQSGSIRLLPPEFRASLLFWTVNIVSQMNHSGYNSCMSPSVPLRRNFSALLPDLSDGACTLQYHIESCFDNTSYISEYKTWHNIFCSAASSEEWQ